MSKIASLGAQLGKLFGIGHGKTSDGQRRSDRKPPRDSTTPVKSVKSRKVVTFSDEIERSEHEAIDERSEHERIDGKEHPAEGKSNPSLDALLTALSQASKNPVRRFESRIEALAKAKDLYDAHKPDGGELDVGRLRGVLRESLSSHSPHQLRRIIRNALEANLQADRRKTKGQSTDDQQGAADRDRAAHDEEWSQYREQQVMKMVVEACHDLLSDMKKATPLQDFHPRINRFCLEYAFAHWLLEPARLEKATSFGPSNIRPPSTGHMTPGTRFSWNRVRRT
jgi:hypothetical protein